MPRRFLIAPDKFKGSLTARQAADAIAVGVRRIFPDAELDLCPIADGGEGFMETLAPTLQARWIECPAVDAIGYAITSRFLLAETPDGPTAILEMAETAGMRRLQPTELSPLHATTAGVGQQMAHAFSNQKIPTAVGAIGIYQNLTLAENQPGSRSFTASRSSLSSAMVASIFSWLKASIGKPCTISHLPFSIVRIGNDVMRPFSMP